MGFKAIALDYMMDNGMADASPKTALAWFSPEEAKKQGDFLQPLSAQAGTEPQSDMTTPQDGGNGMTSFERESRGSAGSATPESQPPGNRNTAQANSNPSITSYNGVMVDVRDNGGRHYEQNGKIFYKKGETFYGAEKIPGGNYSVAEVPESEAKGIIAKEIMDNGKSLYARNRIYYLHDGTAYDIGQKADGSTEAYAVSPHEDADIYTVAHSKGRSMPTAEDPLIDPVEVATAGLIGGVSAAAKTGGTLMARIGAGAKSAGRDMAQEAATQVIQNTLKRW